MKKISPSMMCVEIDRLKEYLKVFEREEIEYLHVDIMDGAYVPNFTLGTDYVKQLRKLTDIPLDVHMMVDHPEQKIGWFDFGEGEYISVHVEATPHIQKVLKTIRESGAKPMAALNPGTGLERLEYILDDIDGVLIMTVNPGFAGQKAVPAALKKIRDCREFLDARGYCDVEIEVDGNVSYELAGEMSKCGADIFVAGSSSFLNGLAGVEEGIRRMRGLI